MRQAALILMLAAALLLTAPAGGQLLQRSAAPAQKQLSARAIVSHDTVAPGDSLHVAVELTIAEGFSVYGPAPGGRFTVRRLEVSAVATRLTPGQALYGPTRPHTVTGLDGRGDTYNVYEHTGYVYLPVTVPLDATPGAYDLTVRIDGQLCDPQVCILLAEQVPVRIEVGAATAASAGWTGPVKDTLGLSRPAEAWRAEVGIGPSLAAAAKVVVFGESGLFAATIWGALLSAFVAGLAINIMPCVLPVIPLRLLALLNQAGQSRRRFVTLGLAFAGGMVLFFAGLAAANIVLKSALDYTLKWGDLFRHPEVVIALSLLLVALAVNMFGVFTITVPGRVAGAQARRGHLGAVGMGLLFTVLSAPCSGALIAAAFGWAQLRTLAEGTLILMVMGLAMAAPHVLLASLPGLLRRIPHAGRWTGLFKESVGFVFLIVAIWLLGTLTESSYLAWVLAYGVVLALCLWMWGTWVGPATAGGRKFAVRAAAVVIAAACGWWMLTPPAPLAVRMQPFEPAQVALARQGGRPVLVKFTASWCAACKQVDRRIYNDREVARRLAAAGVIAIKGDVTRRDMPASEMLYGELGQIGPPITAIFPPGGRPPIVLRGVFDKADLFKALEQAEGP